MFDDGYKSYLGVLEKYEHPEYLSTFYMST